MKLTDEQIKELLKSLPPWPWRWCEDKWHGGWKGVVDASGEAVIWPVLDPDDEDIDRAPWFHEEELSSLVRLFTEQAPVLVQELLERAEKAEAELKAANNELAIPKEALEDHDAIEVESTQRELPYCIRMLRTRTKRIIELIKEDITWLNNIVRNQM